MGPNQFGDVMNIMEAQLGVGDLVNVLDYDKLYDHDSCQYILDRDGTSSLRLEIYSIAEDKIYTFVAAFGDHLRDFSGLIAIANNVPLQELDAYLVRTMLAGLRLYAEEMSEMLDNDQIAKILSHLLNEFRKIV